MFLKCFQGYVLTKLRGVLKVFSGLRFDKMKHGEAIECSAVVDSARVREDWLQCFWGPMVKGSERSR